MISEARRHRRRTTQNAGLLGEQNNQVVGEIHIDGNTIGKGNVVRNGSGDSGEKADLKKRISATKKIIKEKEKELSQISAIHFIKRNVINYHQIGW